MTDLLYAEINVVGIVLLLLFLNNMKRSGQKSISFDQKIFNACLIMNILVFVFDTGMWLLDGQQHEVARVFNYIVTTVYYILNPLFCLVWLMYTDYKINESQKSLFKRFPFYAIPCVIIGILSLISPFTGWLFEISTTNVYSRGQFFLAMAMVSLFYLVLSFALSLKDAIRNGWESNKNVYIHLVIFPIGVVVASIIQIMFYGVSIIWVSTMLALASIYINIQNSEMSTDHLTGLNNRRRLDEHFQKRVKAHKNEHLLFAIVIDLDDLKKINDEHGHAAGDGALIKMAELLRQVCKGSDDFIARMGGDEFLVMGERAKADEIIKLMDDISFAAGELNKAQALPYLLQPSIGFSIFNKDDTINSFFASADQAMYRNKQKRKLPRD